MAAPRVFAVFAVIGIVVALTSSVAEAEGQAGGRFATDELLVEQVYQDVFGRGADEGGLAYWSNQLRGGASPAEVYNAFVD
ncbi:MAG: DUF4214 domain-containing protein, partial [Acidimicrobiia bacterium]|nr:DUF4214 domain-containing protein [Acidimicrobiia bacterium]